MTNDADVRRMSGRRHHLPTCRSSSRAIRARRTVCRQDSRLLRPVSAQPAAIIETASTPTGTIEAPVAAMDWFLSLPAFLSASLSVFGFWPSPGVVVPGSSPGSDSGWDQVRIRLRRRVRIGFRIRLRIRVGIGFLRHRDRHRGRHRRHRDGCDGDCGRTGLQRLHRAVLADADRVTCDRPRDRLVDGILGVTVTPRPTLWPTVMSSLPSLTPSPVTARPVT